MSSNKEFYRVLNMKNTFTYDNSGNYLTILDEEWSNNAWLNYFRYTRSFNNSGNLLLELDENWVNNEWVNDSRYTYTYNSSGKCLIALVENWVNNTWVNSWRTTNTYDNSGNCLTNLYQKWSNNAWANIFRFSYVYDNNGNCIHGEFYLYPGTIGMANVSIQIWFNHHQDALTFHGVNSVDVEYTTITGVTSELFNNLSFNLQQNYPNPFNPTTTINYSLAKEGNVKLTVYDAIGSKVATIVNEYKPAGNYSVNFNATELPSGTYYYKIEAGQFSQIKKMILLK